MHPILFLLIVFLSPFVLIVAVISILVFIHYLTCQILTLLHVSPVEYPYAYKALKQNVYGELESPTMPGTWIDGYLKADVEPTAGNETGIYCCKYYWHWQMHWPGRKIFIVKMTEPVIEHEYGYRASDAYVVEEA